MSERALAGPERRIAPRHVARAVLASLCLVSTVLSSSACGSSVDLKQVLTVSDLAGGYFDAGIVEGKNKLQPSLSFRIGRNGDRPRTISLNVHFRKIVGTEMEEWDEVFLQTVEFAEGSRTALITARTQAGYTGDPPQSRAEMLQNPKFQDMRAIIFARQSSSNWVELARYDLPRQVLTN
jgi:hypothetical protein